jgi:type II secretory pathway component GspD/PulD (secretin)
LPALIKAGGQVPFQDAKVVPPYPAQLQVAWKDVGVNMNMTPAILPNNMVQLTLTELQVSDVNRIENVNGVDLPTISIRSQTGVVMVPDGTTLVIGGLTSRVVRGNEQRVPILGKIPLLGIPFRYRKSDAETRSLLVFVSPTIVDLRAPTDAAKNALDFWKEHGAEWSNANQIKSEVEAMQSGL